MRTMPNMRINFEKLWDKTDSCGIHSVDRVVVGEWVPLDLMIDSAQLNRPDWTPRIDPKTLQCRVDSQIASTGCTLECSWGHAEWTSNESGEKFQLAAELRNKKPIQETTDIQARAGSGIGFSSEFRSLELWAGEVEEFREVQLRKLIDLAEWSTRWFILIGSLPADVAVEVATVKLNSSKHQRLAKFQSCLISLSL